MRPNRRHLWTGLYLPGVVREGVGEVAIAVDCSGSVSGRQLRLFEAEVRSILEGQRPERVYVLYFDAVVHKVETYEAGQRIDLNPVGGGGTEFGPCFEWLDEQGHPAADPGLSDRSLRIIPAVRSRLSRPVGFDRKPEGPVRRGHSHAGCLAPNGSMGCGASAQANEDLNLTPIIRWSPQLIWGRRLSVDQTYRIFTDGSAIGNPGPGGWGVVVMQGKRTLGNVRRLSLDDHLGDGIGRGGSGASATSRPSADRAAFGLRIPDLWNAQPSSSAGSAKAGETGAETNCSTVSCGRS